MVDASNKWGSYELSICSYRVLGEEQRRVIPPSAGCTEIDFLCERLEDSVIAQY